MRLRIVLFCTALGTGLLPASGQAGIIFTLGNNPQPGEENVLLNTGTTGTTVFGETNTTHLPVQFTSTQTLTEPANGLARIEATNGTSQIGLTNVTISVPGGSYGDLIFNPDITGTIGVPGGTLHVSVTDNLGDVVPFDYTLSNGNNFLTITTTGGERIVSTSLSYSLDVGFTDLREVRISGAAIPATGVPEPSSIVLLGLGSLSLLGYSWRRRKQVVA
jgi:hypothetical protein